VKIRGFRVEPDEIAAVMRRCPGVADARVLARDGGDGLALMGFFVALPGQTVTSARLRRHVRECLPEHMTPSAFVSLPAWPLTANGKLDLRALPDPESPRLASGPPIESPLQSRIVEVWREALRHDAFGLDDNFFDVGGHSLLIIEVYARLRDVLGVEFPLMDMFQHTTIRALREYFDKGRASASDAGASRAETRKRMAGTERRDAR
jgi:hypothetical protein